MPTSPRRPVVARSAPDVLGLTDGLVQLSYTVQAVLGRLADTHGLTLTQVRMLAVLEDREIGMQQLARILELEKSSVSGLVDRAERRGLVRRDPAPDDRRSTHVVLTPEARALIGAVRRGVETEVHQLTAHLDTDQRTALRIAIGTVLDTYTTQHALPT